MSADVYKFPVFRSLYSPVSSYVVARTASPSSINFDSRRQVVNVGVQSAKVFQLNNRQITQALNDYGVLNKVIGS